MRPRAYSPFALYPKSSPRDRACHGLKLFERVHPHLTHAAAFWMVFIGSAVFLTSCR